jgi:hypothetical protein
MCDIFNKISISLKTFPNRDYYLFFPPAKNFNSGLAFESFDFCFEELVSEPISLALVNPFPDDLDGCDLDPRDFFESLERCSGSSMDFADFLSSSLIPETGLPPCK